jgi:hypothetical protein
MLRRQLDLGLGAFEQTATIHRDPQALLQQLEQPVEPGTSSDDEHASDLRVRHLRRVELEGRADLVHEAFRTREREPPDLGRLR